MTDLEKIIQAIENENNDVAYILEGVSLQPESLLLILEKARQYHPPRLHDLRILAYQHMEGIPFPREDGVVKRLHLPDSPEKAWFAEWENPLGVKSIIGHYTPDGFIGVYHEDVDFEAEEKREAETRRRCEDRKQEAAKTIARAVLRVVTDERFAKTGGKDVEPAPHAKAEKTTPRGYEGLGLPKNGLNEYDLSALTDKQEMAIKLRLGWERPKAEIARRMGVSRPVVDKHLAEAAKKLKVHKSRRGW